jgi:hypothetical protein
MSSRFVGYFLFYACDFCDVFQIIVHCLVDRKIFEYESLLAITNNVKQELSKRG